MGACSELKYFVYSKVYSFSSVLFGAIIVKIMGQKRAILQPKELKSHTNMFMGGGRGIQNNCWILSLSALGQI